MNAQEHADTRSEKIEVAIFAFRSAFQRMNELTDDIEPWDRCSIFLDALKTEQTLRDLLNTTPEQELTEQQIKLRNGLDRLAPNARKLQQQATALAAQANDAKKVFESFIASGSLN